MAFKEVTDLSADTAINLGGKDKKTGKSNPTTLTGYFLGSKKIDSKKARNGFDYLHIFQTQKGNVGVWGKTDLNRKMLAVKPGFMTRVTLVGTVPTPNGDMYKFKVEADSENTIDVSGVANQEEESQSTSVDDGVSYDDVEETTLDQEEELLDEVTLPSTKRLATNVAADADRAARVKELLSKGRKTA